MALVSAAVMDSPGMAAAPPGAFIILRTSSSASAGDSPTTPAGAGTSGAEAGAVGWSSISTASVASGST
eukprot:4918190-Alexandrium_andersonii.AAC.1